MSQEGFDVDAVPVFPVFSLLLDEDAERVELDGLPVEVCSGQEVTAAAIEAVAAKAERHGLAAVRVRARTRHDELWDMVITAAGRVIDTTTDPETPKSTRAGRGRWVLSGAAALLSLALAGTGIAAWAASQEPPEVSMLSSPWPYPASSSPGPPGRCRCTPAAT